jgi:uncharacterized membrane protein YhaH (DUF805 family)
VSTPYGSYERGQEQQYQGQQYQGQYQAGQYGYGGYPGPAYPPGPYPPGPYAQDGYYPGGQRVYLQGAQVGFGQAIKEAFRNMFVYRGRASRSAYWWFVLFEVIAFIVLEAVAIGPLLASHGAPNIAVDLLGLVATAAIIVVVLTALSLFVRRMHDSDRSGWWFFLSFVPLVGGIVLLVFTVSDGTPGPNRYG